MKLLSLALLGLFTFALVGCEASGSVGKDSDHVDSDSRTSYHKTTVVHPNGETTVKTETHHEND